MFKKGYNKEIARAMTLYITYSVIGPLLVFGGIGYFIDRVLETRFFLLFSVFVAYVISNILMFRKLKSINHSINVIDSRASEEKEKLELSGDSSEEDNYKE